MDEHELPPDPWAVDLEEIERRLEALEGDDSEEAEVFRRVLRVMGVEAPRADLTLKALVDMPSAVELLLALKALTDDDRQTVLWNLLWSVHRHNKTPEAFDEWARPPEFRPDDDAD